MNHKDSAVPCLMSAWQQHEAELRSWLRHQLDTKTEAEDLLQDLFIKALRQGERFCSVSNARAWLFEVARNMVSDRYRKSKPQIAFPDDLPALETETEVVDSLASCLPKALRELSPEDGEVLTMCDLEGMTQEAYAQLKGLTLPAAKSRIQRARKRLKTHLSQACQVKIGLDGRVCCFTPRN